MPVVFFGHRPPTQEHKIICQAEDTAGPIARPFANAVHHDLVQLNNLELASYKPNAHLMLCTYPWLQKPPIPTDFINAVLPYKSQLLSQTKFLLNPDVSPPWVKTWPSMRSLALRFFLQISTLWSQELKEMNTDNAKRGHTKKRNLSSQQDATAPKTRV